MNSLARLLFLTFTFTFTFTYAAYFDTTSCTSDTPCLYVAPTGRDTNNGSISSPFRTIQRAFNLINATATTVPTTIVLNNGVYPGGIVWMGSAITLTSISGAASTFIDCARIPNQRGIWIGSGETLTTIVSGVTIRNCRNTMGAGMAIVGETTKPMIRDVMFVNNSATMGGGMLVFFGSPTLIGVNFTANQARDGAGLMITHNGTSMPPQQYQVLSLALNYDVDNILPLPTGNNAFVSITGSTFRNNVAAGLGASINLLAANQVSCQGCTFIGGVASGSGAIAAGVRSKFDLSDCMFMNNRAMNLNGGAVSIQQGSSTTITRCIFQNNTANQMGGGVAVGTQGTATITDSIFDANQASVGSIVFIDVTATGTIRGCSTSNNIALNHGGIKIMNPASATIASENMSANTFNNNIAVNGYGADYASYPASLVFAMDNSTSMMIRPTNISTSATRSVQNLDLISLRLLLLDTFGQRIELPISNQTDLYADVVTLDNDTTPALLVQSTRVRMPQGIADVDVILVGEVGATYAVTWTVDHPRVQPIRLLVDILPCQPTDVTTYYDQTNFPICQAAPTRYISSSFFHGIIIISCILIALVIIVQGLTIWYWNTPVFKTSTPLFMSLMLVGAIIGYLSTILSVIDVDRTSDGLSAFNQICKTQYWMMGTAFVLMFATLALKTWRIRNIFCNSTLTEIRTVNTWALLRWLMVLVAIEMLIHVLWISIDPLHAVMALNGSHVAATCVSSHETAFLIANLIYKGVIALVCVLFAYQTRDVTSRFNESRQLMIASYNMFVCVIVIATLSLALPDVDARRTVYSVGSLFVITSTWFVLFAPKLYLAIFDSQHNVSLGIATGTGSGGKNSHDSLGRKTSIKGSTYQTSKNSYNNINNSGPGTATPTRSKAGSTANTAPGSPMMPAVKLSLNLGTRSSVSTMPTPISPQLSSTLNIPRHLSIAGTPKTMTLDDLDGISPLDLTQQQPGGVGRRSSQPNIYDPNANSSGDSTGTGHYTPAKNFI